jgi:hypothetical protein
VCGLHTRANHVKEPPAYGRCLERACLPGVQRWSFCCALHCSHFKPRQRPGRHLPSCRQLSSAGAGGLRDDTGGKAKLLSHTPAAGLLGLGARPYAADGLHPGRRTRPLGPLDWAWWHQQLMPTRARPGRWTMPMRCRRGVSAVCARVPRPFAASPGRRTDSSNARRPLRMRRHAEGCSMWSLVI